VLKLRDGWAPFEREKLLPRSYNLPVGTLVAMVVELGLKDDAQTSLQSHLFRLTGFWLCFLFAHADQIFKATQYLSRESY
jgi:hypothetical protein